MQRGAARCRCILSPPRAAIWKKYFLCDISSTISPLSCLIFANYSYRYCLYSDFSSVAHHGAPVDPAAARHCACCTYCCAWYFAAAATVTAAVHQKYCSRVRRLPPDYVVHFSAQMLAASIITNPNMSMVQLLHSILVANIFSS